MSANFLDGTIASEIGLLTGLCKGYRDLSCTGVLANYFHSDFHSWWQSATWHLAIRDWRDDTAW